MKRLPASSKPAKFNQLSSLATVTGFIGLSFGVLVLVFSLQWQEGQTGRELSRSLHGRGEYETIIYVEHVGSQRRIYQNRDQSDITDYSIEELLNRAHASTEKGLDEVFVLLVVGEGATAGDFVNTMNELKESGIDAFTLSEPNQTLETTPEGASQL